MGRPRRPGRGNCRDQAGDVPLRAAGGGRAHLCKGLLLDLSGKTIVGALVVSFVSVEITKRIVGIKAPTGDGFALSFLVGTGVGRIGCFLNGCCYGSASSGPDAVFMAGAFLASDAALRIRARARLRLRDRAHPQTTPRARSPLADDAARLCGDPVLYGARARRSGQARRPADRRPGGLPRRRRVRCILRPKAAEVAP